MELQDFMQRMGKAPSRQGRPMLPVMAGLTRNPLHQGLAPASHCTKTAQAKLL